MHVRLWADKVTMAWPAQPHSSNVSSWGAQTTSCAARQHAPGTPGTPERVQGAWSLEAAGPSAGAAGMARPHLCFLVDGFEGALQHLLALGQHTAGRQAQDTNIRVCGAVLIKFDSSIPIAPFSLTVPRSPWSIPPPSCTPPPTHTHPNTQHTPAQDIRSHHSTRT